MAHNMTEKVWTEEEKEKITLIPEDQLFASKCISRTIYFGISSTLLTDTLYVVGVRKWFPHWSMVRITMSTMLVSLIGFLPGTLVATYQCMKELSTLDTPLGRSFRSEVRGRNFRLAMMRGDNPHLTTEPLHTTEEQRQEEEAEESQ